MSETPEPPPTEPPPSAAPRAPRLRTSLIVVGAAFLLVIIAVAVAVVVVPLLGAHRGPTQTVDAFIQSVEAGDCTLYVAVTTEAFRNGTIAAEDCETSGVFSGSGAIDYELDITGSEVTGNAATVTAILSIVDTSTPDVDPTVSPITFDLVQEAGTWKVDASY